MTTGPAKESGTLLLVSLAAGSFAVARIPSCMSLTWMLTTSACFITAPWLVWVALHNRRGRQIDRRFTLLLIIWALLPLGIQLVMRHFGVGDLWVVTMLITLQNVSLILGAFSHRPRAASISCLFAAFIVLFAIAIGTSTAVYMVAGLFGVMMLWWLMSWLGKSRRCQEHLDASGAVALGAPR